jgi:hypothetical protein
MVLCAAGVCGEEGGAGRGAGRSEPGQRTEQALRIQDIHHRDAAVQLTRRQGTDHRELRQKEKRTRLAFKLHPMGTCINRAEQ